MSIAMRYCDGAVGVVYDCSGIVTSSEIQEVFNEQLANRGKLKKRKYFLIDFTRTNELRLSTQEIKLVVTLERQVENVVGKNVGAIVANTDVMFGMGRMWDVYVEAIDWETKVFRLRDEAEEWLKTTIKAEFNCDITLTDDEG